MSRRTCAQQLQKITRQEGMKVEDKALMYDLAAREKSEIPSDFEDTLMYTESGKIMRRAIRMTNEGLADEEDWRDFIRRLEKKKKET